MTPKHVLCLTLLILFIFYVAFDIVWILNDPYERVIMNVPEPIVTYHYNVDTKCICSEATDDIIECLNITEEYLATAEPIVPCYKPNVTYNNTFRI